MHLHLNNKECQNGELNESCWRVSLSTTILAIIFWDILMFDIIFVSPQVKRIVIIGNKHGIYKLPQRVAKRLKT